MKFDFHQNHRLLFSVVLLGFIALSIIVAVVPALWVNAHNHPLPGSRPLTALERQGLDVYLAEGCVYCHTQQVRPIAQDTSRYGRPSVPGDYARLVAQDAWRQTPSILGTERTGPDLSNIGERQPSEAWHLIHLYNPRAVVSGSIMPAFPWLFEVKDTPGDNDVIVPMPEARREPGGVIVAGPGARALVAYLLSLRQAPLAASGASRSTSTGDVLGSRVYDARCASCHQPDGRGVAGTFPPLAGDPVVLADDPTRHIEIVLFGLTREPVEGAQYAVPMPAWADELTDREIAAVVNHERSAWGNDAPRVTAEQVAEIRQRRAR
jgi:cytochrome c oxidase cbb3-type subunit 2